MSCLATVIASDVGFILLRRAPLSSVDVYGASIRAVRYAAVVTLLFIVKSVGLVRTVPTPTLLLTRVLPIVDPNCYSDVVVKRVRPIDFIQLVLDLFLKAFVESLHKALLAILYPERVLSEDSSVGGRRLSLAQARKPLLGVEFLVRVAKHLSEFLLERVVLLEDFLGEVVLILFRLGLESIL